jgi:hypothetical protein
VTCFRFPITQWDCPVARCHHQNIHSQFRASLSLLQAILARLDEHVKTPDIKSTAQLQQEPKEKTKSVVLYS